jgi:hypothetical protein
VINLNLGIPSLKSTYAERFIFDLQRIYFFILLPGREVCFRGGMIVTLEMVLKKLKEI